MYMIWQAGIALFLTAATSLFLIGAFKLFENGAPETYFWAVPALFAAAGAMYSYAAIQRARDAGRTRRFALLGIVPIGNLWLLFSPPKAAPERPPYVPSSGSIRIVIGLCALVAIAATRMFDQYGSQKLLELQIADRVEKQVAAQNANLPNQLDEITILQAVDTDINKKEIVYRYTLTGSNIDSKNVQSWLTTTMKPKTAKTICQDPIVSQFGWIVRYRYWDTASNLVAEIYISKSDC